MLNLNQGFAPIFVIVVVAVGLVLGGVLYYANVANGPGRIACTQEARQCPDGSYVGRTGPNCEFAECPGEAKTTDWQNYRSERYGFEVQIPSDWSVGEYREEESGIEFTSSETLRRNEENIKNCSGEGVGSCIPEMETWDIIFVNHTAINEAPPNSAQDWVVNGIEFKSYISYGLFTTTYYEVIRSGRIYNFGVLRGREAAGEKILSSLKFIEPLDTSTWKTYRSEQWGFEVKYPVEYRNLPLKDGKRQGQIEAWSVKDGFNNDRFFIVLAIHESNSFEYADYTTGGKYLFDAGRKSWKLSPDVTQTQTLLNLVPTSLNLPFEAYKYRGGSGFCVWDSYLIPLSAQGKLVELQHNACGNPVTAEDVNTHNETSPVVLSTFKFIQ